jgi:Fe2+ transport system protein FeoA
VRRAPLGDPLELRLRNYALSIGREEAARIEVETAG